MKFRVVRVWEDGDRATFRFTNAKFDTRAEAVAHRAKLQDRFPNYLFWVTGGNTDRVMTIYKGPAIAGAVQVAAKEV